MSILEISVLIFLMLSTSHLEAANILAVFPFPGPSQYMSAEPYLKALAAKGHDLTVVSCFPQKEKLLNFRDITLVYEGYEELISNTVKANNYADNDWLFEFAHNVTLNVLENHEFQAVFKSGQKFDLVILEAFLNDALFALAPHFNAHLIGFSTFGTDIIIDQFVDNTSPISYIPLMSTGLTNRMNFWQRLQNLMAALFEQYFSNQNIKVELEIYQKYFSHLTHKLEDVRTNFSLVLLNQHFSISFPRPYVPNMIEVGGLYLNHQHKPLPADIENFISKSEHGVIYFAMGSNVKSKYFPKEKLDIVLKVFGALKQRVLWKFEEPNLPGKPANVFISKWFPQQDILAHPKIKLFITHAGLLSIIESIQHAKPVVGVPVFFDQFMNIEHMKQIGCGLSVPFRNLNEQDLKAAILEVLGNETYATTMQILSKRFRDQPIKPLDNAIFWTEYVLRHNGAPHMRVAARHLNFIQFYCLDTIGFILITTVLALILLSYSLKLFIKLICKFTTPKNKRKYN